MTDKPSDYSAKNLQILEGLEAVRKRPGMYIGSTDQRGLMHCLWEILDNSVDEALEGYCDKIKVILHSDRSVTVTDNGRGIPVDIVKQVGLSGVEVVFTKLHAGGKFGGKTYASSGGLHGVGASVVNALSQRLDVEVDRSGRTYSMSFSRGQAGVFNSSDSIGKNNFTPFKSKSELNILKEVPKKQTGTRIRFWPDDQIFLKNIVFSYEQLVNRARQTAFLIPGLKIVVCDERDNDHIQDIFKFDGGISDFVEFITHEAPITDIWKVDAQVPYTETVQQLDEHGHLHPVEVERKCIVSCAMQWNKGYESEIKSFVNIISTPKGGTHVVGYENALIKFFRKYIEKNARKFKLNTKNSKVEKEDILAGLTAIISVRLPEPQFEGQTKEILGTAQVKNIVNNVVSEFLEYKFDSKLRDDKQQKNVLIEKIVGEMRARISAKINKEITRRKSALETSTLPAKLADCSSKDVSSSELFIVEGDSALGTAKSARIAKFQALLPIRGKILNVQKSSISDMLSNAECASIIQVIGGGSGKSFDINNARYGKVILMTDADVDGAHIRTLLLTLFFRYMRPMIEQGRVYAAVPPLHRVEISPMGRKKKEIVYTYSEEELHKLLIKLDKSGRKYKEPIQRYKGLGEMDADQLAETTMDPNLRTLRRITFKDEHELYKAEGIFELLMGNIVAPRKEFIVNNSHKFDRNKIDA